MFDTYTERMRKVVAQAYAEARGRGDPQIRPGHLFMAILKVKGGDACEALANLGVDEAQARTAMIRVMGPGGAPGPSKQLLFSPGALAAVDPAEELHLDLYAKLLDTSHFLLCLLEDRTGDVARMLEVLEVPLPSLRSEIYRVLQQKGPTTRQNVRHYRQKMLKHPCSEGVRDLIERVADEQGRAFEKGQWELSARMAGKLGELCEIRDDFTPEEWRLLAKKRLTPFLPRASGGLVDDGPPAPQG